MPPQQSDNRLWDTAKQVSETHATVQNIEKRLDKLPCMVNSQAIASLETKAKGLGALFGMMGALVVAGMIHVLKALIR